MGELFGFEKALQILKKGGLVARSGWNGKGMFLYVAYPKHTDGRENEAIMVNRVFQSKERSLASFSLSISNFIIMKTADDELIPWLASQTDLLAEDWCEKFVTKGLKKESENE